MFNEIRWLLRQRQLHAKQRHQFGRSILYLGELIGSSGSYNLSGSGLLTATSEYIGYSGTGSFTQSGGTNTANSLYLAGQA